MSKLRTSWQIMQKKRIVFCKNLHSWQTFYTTAGRDCCDKFQPCWRDHVFNYGLFHLYSVVGFLSRNLKSVQE